MAPSSIPPPLVTVAPAAGDPPTAVLPSPRLPAPLGPSLRRWPEALACVALLFLAYYLRQRVGQGWTFAGSDSYAYLGAARELAENHRYAFRLPDWYPDHAAARPLGYCRLPGYPIFLSLFAFLSHRGWPALGDYELIFGRVKTPQALLDVGTCLLVFALTRRLAGRGPALIALALAAVFPPLIFFANAVLTETLATALSTLYIALLARALWQLAPGAPSAGQRSWVAASAVLALASLVRVDSLFLLPTLLLPLLWQRWEALRRLPWVLLAFVLCFAPWPLRNKLSLGELHPLGGQCDVRGDAMAHTAFFAWFATWVSRESQTPATLYCMFRRECVADISTYPPEAFDSPAEKAAVQALFALRQREGMSAQVDAGFRQLATARLRAHPLRTLVWLPLLRAMHLWTTAIDQPLRATRSPPWPSVVRRAAPLLLPLQVLLLSLGLLGLLRVARIPSLRPFAWLAAACLLLRTGALSLIGFVENRYVLELFPLLLVLSGVGLSSLFLAAAQAVKSARADDK